MTSTLTIYSAISFLPFEETGLSTYHDYVESQADVAKKYVLLSLQLSSYFPHNNFIVVTNEPYVYLSIAKRFNRALPLFQYCPFHFHVDPGTPFRLAHFKIDVWSHIAHFCTSSHACLLDLDIVGLPNSYDKLKKLTDEKVDLFFYDQFSTQIRSYGESVILRDINLLSPLITKKIWAGGEFLLGTTASFLAIYNCACSMHTTYLNSLNQLRHIGDEAVLTSALISVSDSLSIKSVNQFSIINRIFLARLLKGAKRQTLNDITGFSLLHLPSSKKFLASPFYQVIPALFRYPVLYLYMVSCIVILRFLPCR